MINPLRSIGKWVHRQYFGRTCGKDNPLELDDESWAKVREASHNANNATMKLIKATDDAVKKLERRAHAMHILSEKMRTK